MPAGTTRGPRGSATTAVSGSLAFFQPFHSAKSRGSRFLATDCGSAATSAASMSSMRWWVSSPYCGQERTSK